jgi:hypothetical protein
MLMTNITNEQLEAWAGLGPWDVTKSAWDERHYVEGENTICHMYALREDDHAILHCDNYETNAALIAAAPTLAAALLAERKAREVEVGELKFEVGMKDKAIRLALKRLEELTNQTGTFALFASDIALIRQALKGPTP